MIVRTQFRNGKNILHTIGFWLDIWTLPWLEQWFKLEGHIVFRDASDRGEGGVALFLDKPPRIPYCFRPLLQGGLLSNPHPDAVGSIVQYESFLKSNKRI